jgi:membrane-bound serine protease (ClpP class)
VLLGVLLLGLDTYLPSHGALTLSGLLALGFGLATLFHDSSGFYTTSVPLVVTLTVVIGGLWAFAISKAIAVRRRPVLVGPGDIVGMQGVVREGGLVQVHGELWKAKAGEPLRTGQRVEVDQLDGLTLHVHPV